MKGLLVAASFLYGCLLGSTAFAQVLVPTFDAVCDSGHVVDKQKLATFLLDTKPVSRTLEDWAINNPDPNFPVGPRERMLIDPSICDTAKAGSACRRDDPGNLAQMLQVVALLLNDYGTTFDNESKVETPYKYFVDTRARLICRVQNPQPADSATPPVTGFKYTFPIRVRATTDGLNFDRDEPSFAVVQGAKIEFADDNANHKKTQKWSAVAGFALPPTVSNTHTSLSFVPYVGWVRDFTRVTGKDDVTTSNSYSGGILADFRRRQVINEIGITHYFTFMPEYRLSDSDKDTSKLWTISATWMPILNGYTNSYSPFVRGQQVASWRFIFDVRAIHGWFNDPGNLAAPYNRGFTRFGTQFGLALKSDNPRWPLDFVVTQTVLSNLQHGKDLSHLFGRLSFAFDPKRIFTLDLTYSNGRRADVLADENAWKLAFAAKY